MVRLCFALLLLRKEQDGIHMPRRLMDDLEGEVADEKFHECAFGYDIFSADLNCEASLLLNVRQHRVFSVTHNVSRLVCGECIGKVANPLLNMVSECVLALISYLDISMSFNGADLARNDAVLQPPRRFPLRTTSITFCPMNILSFSKSMQKIRNSGKRKTHFER